MKPKACLQGSAHPFIIPVLLLLLGLFSTGLSQDNPVSVRLEIFVVSVVDGEERYTAATTARPGQVVEYRLFATNVGDTSLPPGTVVLTGPIPEGTSYIANSATPSSERLLTEYTADEGRSYDETLVFVGADDNRRLADPAEYTAVRWTLLVDMAPEEEEAFFYRVTVE